MTLGPGTIHGPGAVVVVVDGRVVDDVDVWDVVLVVRADPVEDVGRVVDVGEPAVVLGVVGC